MAGNTSLNAAAKAKEDEFYTQLADIERELSHYRPHFQGKTVLCNCDDPYESNFFKYFALYFNHLGLKRLLATSYVDSPIAGTQLPLFEIPRIAPQDRDKPYRAIVTQVYDKTGGGLDMLDVAELFKSGENELTTLLENGDFRSRECLELLQEADIVVTNPPFSLFREFVATLMEYKKKFVIIGNQNAISYKEIFPLLQNNQMWLGYHAGDMSFTVPDSYEPRETRYWQDENGRKWRSMGNICWFTNLDIGKRHEELVLIRKYDKEKYPTYVNFNAIEVSNFANIPYDYAGLMGVPITFMDKYNPDQFEIVGISRELGQPMSQFAKPGTYQTGGMRFYLHERDKQYEYKRVYERLVIRNRHPEEPKA